MNAFLNSTSDALEIIAFMLHEQQFCVRTTSIREIRGWAPVTPFLHTQPEVLGVMNLRGTVIPIVDLSVKLGMSRPARRSVASSSSPTSRARRLA